MGNEIHMRSMDMTVQVPVKRKGSDVLETFRAYKNEKGNLYIKMDGNFYPLDWILEFCGARCRMNG